MHCLKFQRSTTLGCKKIGVAQFFLQKMLCKIPEFLAKMRRLPVDGLVLEEGPLQLIAFLDQNPTI